MNRFSKVIFFSGIFFFLFSFSGFCVQEVDVRSSDFQIAAVSHAFELAGIASSEIIPLEVRSEQGSLAQSYRYFLGADGKAYGKGQEVTQPSKTLKVEIQKTKERWMASAVVLETDQKDMKKVVKKYSAKKLEDALRMALIRLRIEGRVFDPAKEVAQHPPALSTPQNPWPDRQITIFPTTSGNGESSEKKSQ